VGQKIQDTPWKWLSDISSKSEVKPQILIFDYTFEKNGAPIWQSLVQRGGEIMTSLVEQDDAFGVSAPPLLARVVLTDSRFSDVL
jgi:hypothetical protein